MVLDTTKERLTRQITTAELSSEEMISASRVKVKLSRRLQETPVLSAMLTMVESVKWRMLNTQLVVSTWVIQVPVLRTVVESAK